MKKILILLSNGFEMYEAAVFSDVFGFAKTGGIEIETHTLGLHRNLRCTYNFSVTPEFIYPKINLNDYDALAIPGGRRDAGYLDDAYSEQFQEIICAFAKRNKIIAGVCMGVMPIAKCGLLKGKEGTTYPGKRREELKEMGVLVRDLSLVVSANIITSSSPATGLDVAFTLLEMLTDRKSTIKIRKAFGYSTE